MLLTGKMKRYFYWFLPLLLLAGTVVGCEPAYPEISLKHPEDIEVVTAPTPQYRPNIPVSFGLEVPFVRMAIAPVVSLTMTRGNYRKLPAYLPEKLQQPVELVFRSTYAEINQLIIRKLVDVALIGNWSYVELSESGDVELLGIPQINGQTKHHSYIIVPAESNIYNLEDLKDEKFIFTDPLSFPGKLYVLYRLAQMGETPDSFFAEYIYSYSHDSSIIAVAERWVNAAAVDSLVYDNLVEINPELKKKIRIIDSSPPLSNPPLVISTKIQPELQQKLKDTFLSMHLNEEGQKALAEMGVERFVPGQDEDYDMIRNFINELQEAPK